MKNHFSNPFSFIQQSGNQFKKWKNTKKEEMSLKNENHFSNRENQFKFEKH